MSLELMFILRIVHQVGCILVVKADNDNRVFDIFTECEIHHDVLWKIFLIHNL